MEKINNNSTVQILNAINNFQYEMVKSMNYIREDMKELKEDIKEVRDELREFKEENNRRWEENNRRWEENDKRWKENETRWEKYETNRKEDRKFLLNVLAEYDISISTQLGDPNVDKMRKLV